MTKIYHITHVDNLSGIVDAGCLWSDARRMTECPDAREVGLSEIKRRRLEEIHVSCHPTTTVGEYVPFYFCPRSIMLFILHKANLADITYREGQRAIVHLEFDLEKVVAWAENQSRKWVFSDRNAGAFVAKFYRDLKYLGRIDWNAINATDFRDPAIKDGKQAECLIYESCPWEFVEQIGVIDQRIARQVQAAIHQAGHQPAVRVERNWYY